MSREARILVTGAAGFVGSHVCGMLLGQGARVRAVDLMAHPWRLNALLSDPNLDYVRANTDELGKSHWTGVREVWHFAANADIPLGVRDRQIDVRDSVGLTARILDMCVQHKIDKFIFASSASVYGLNDGKPLTETAVTLRPESMYAAGKLAAEAYAHAFHANFGLDVTVLRFGNILGASMERGIVLDFIRRLRDDPDHLVVMGDGRQAKSYIHIQDAATAAWTLSRAKEAPGFRVFNVAAGDVATTRQVASEVATALGLPQPTIATSGPDLSWTGDQPVINLDVTHAALQGWVAQRSATEAVRECAAELAEQFHTGRFAQ